jgi:hypothetical protein
MQSIEAPINGMNLYAPRQCRTTTNHGQTPLEAEWMIEVSDAVIEQGFDRKGANELLARLTKRFEGEKPQEGYSITECYDLVHHKPKPDYEKVYIDVKKQLAKMGLKLT